jgi:FkbM family methyltransferase
MTLNSVVRQILRAAFRGRTLRRRLPRSVGGARVYVAPDSQLKYLKPGAAGLDRALLGWAERHVRPGDVVWDIGANSGVFAMAAAGLGAFVLAVEPDPFLANALLRTRAANPRLHVEVLAAAIDDQRGTACLEIASGGRAANALSAFAGARATFGKAEGRLLVPTLRLDDLLPISHPHLVKIDIEGAELAALRGASILLSQIRPKLIVEVASEAWSDVVDILKAHGFRIGDPDDPDREVDAPIFNILATPRL